MNTKQDEVSNKYPFTDKCVPNWAWIDLVVCGGVRVQALASYKQACRTKFLHTLYVLLCLSIKSYTQMQQSGVLST